MLVFPGREAKRCERRVIVLNTPSRPPRKYQKSQDSMFQGYPSKLKLFFYSCLQKQVAALFQHRGNDIKKPQTPKAGEYEKCPYTYCWI